MIPDVPTFAHVDTCAFRPRNDELRIWFPYAHLIGVQLRFEVNAHSSFLQYVAVDLPTLCIGDDDHGGAIFARQLQKLHNTRTKLSHFRKVADPVGNLGRVFHEKFPLLRSEIRKQEVVYVPLMRQFERLSWA